MHYYLYPIKIAAITFPIIAALITFPYFLINYHKYGSVSKLRILIVYTFILYLMCSYFLIILPLPSRSAVAKMSVAKFQLYPFAFITDFIKTSGFNIHNINTYLTALKSSSVYQPIFNIILTIPFGIYLHYYFNCSLKKTALLSFLLSLFFELTQLTGLYFIYPSNYRTFDVDDLFFNTLGGILGYLLFNPFLKLLPSREEIDNRAYEEGKKVSNLRRIFSFITDLFLLIIISVPIYTLFSIKDNFLTISIFPFVYFVIIPNLFHGQTFGKKITQLIIVDENSKYSLKVFYRYLLFYLLFMIIPILIKIYNLNFLAIFYLIYLFVTFIKFMKHKPLWYERVTNTKNISIFEKM
jgi:glycopeptide antibiotics resistance protein